jgi:hypothetical protein
MDSNLLNFTVENLNAYFAKPIYNSGLRFDSTNNIAHLSTGVGQTCAASHKVKSSQSHDFDFFEKNKKVKVMTLTFLKNPKKSKS